MTVNDDDNIDYTSTGECLAAGCMGLLGYSLVCFSALWTLHSFKCGSTRFYVISFLVMMFISGVLSFPWWIVNISDPTGLALWQYSMFIVSRLIFIQAFCIISAMWASFLGREFQKWNIRVLLVLNCILILLTGTGLGLHHDKTALSLHGLYQSSSYRIFVIVEASIYLLLAVFLSFIGMRLLLQISSWSSLSDLGIKTQTFKRALANLRVILAVVVGSFLLQGTMLVVESVYHKSPSMSHSYVLSRRGLLWSLLHDIIPRVVPAVTLMAFMKKNEAIAGGVAVPLRNPAHEEHVQHATGETTRPFKTSDDDRQLSSLELACPIQEGSQKSTVTHSTGSHSPDRSSEESERRLSLLIESSLTLTMLDVDAAKSPLHVHLTDIRRGVSESSRADGEQTRLDEAGPSHERVRGSSSGGHSLVASPVDLPEAQQQPRGRWDDQTVDTTLSPLQQNDAH